MKNNKIKINCSFCNKPRFIYKSNLSSARKRPCRSCSQKFIQIKRFPPSRKGVYSAIGYISSDGYRMVSVGIRQYVREHRLIMEQLLGRKLNPNEKIHHINLDKLDNSINNLLLCKSEAEHRNIHKSLNSLIKKLIIEKIIYFDSNIGLYNLAHLKFRELLEHPEKDNQQPSYISDDIDGFRD